MPLLESVRDLLAGSGSTRNATASETVGAFWCHDCNERIPKADVSGEEPPECPSCGREMAFERSPGSGSCAC